jgi:hypothetical protein
MALYVELFDTSLSRAWPQRSPLQEEPAQCQENFARFHNLSIKRFHPVGRRVPVEENSAPLMNNTANTLKQFVKTTGPQALKTAEVCK